MLSVAKHLVLGLKWPQFTANEILRRCAPQYDSVHPTLDYYKLIRKSISEATQSVFFTV